jgi:hypothetical protein
VNATDKPVPEGRLRVAQDAVLGRHKSQEKSRQGRLRISQDRVLGIFTQFREIRQTQNWRLSESLRNSILSLLFSRRLFNRSQEIHE